MNAQTPELSATSHPQEELDVESSLGSHSTVRGPGAAVALRARLASLTTVLSDINNAGSSVVERAKFGGLAVALGLVLYRVISFERDLLHSLLVDDAYISARHAANLVQGFGLNYNADERVEGYTNFLFTLVMAVPQAFGWPLEPFVRAVGSIAALGVIVAVFRIGRSMVGPAIAALIVGALALDQRFVYFSVWGLETVFASLMVLLGYMFLFGRRLVMAGVFFAAAAMTRIDMLVLVAPSFIYLLLAAPAAAPNGVASGPVELLRSKVRAAWPSWLHLGLPVGMLFGTYFLTRWYYYGWLFPNTFYAKVGGPAKSWKRGLSYVEECFTKMSVGSYLLLALGVWGLCMVLAVRHHGLWRKPWREGFRQAFVFLLSGSAYLAYTVTVGGDQFKERFIYHSFPVVFLASVAGVRWAGEFLWGNKPETARMAWLPAFLFAAVLGGALALTPHRSNTARGIGGWVSLGMYLKDVAPPNAVLATDAAGAIPYFSGLKTIDTLGLADAHIGHLHVAGLGTGATGHEKSDVAYVLGRKPDYLSTRMRPDGLAGRGFGNQFTFNQQYRLAALVRMDSTEVSRERILPIEGEAPPVDELKRLHDGTAARPGRYTWALYQRRPEGARASVPLSGFRSSRHDWLGKGDYIVSVKRGHAPTRIMWGPRTPLDAGRYEGVLRFDVGGIGATDSGQRLCNFDVFDGKRVLLVKELDAESASTRSRETAFSFEVASNQSTSRYEFRMYCWGLADITVKSVQLTHIGR